ncbi:MAG: hypothetical protein MUC64_14800 [Rubritepida sp.]|nr:hypothetical protein [Rubritepida sp.]
MRAGFRARGGWALAGLLLAGAVVAQPSQKLHLTPPGEAGPPAKGAPPPVAAAPAWPPMPGLPSPEPAALARLRGLLGDGVAFGARGVEQQGEVLVVLGAELRRERNRMVIERLAVEGLTETGLRRGALSGVTAETPDGPFRLDSLELIGVALLPLDPGQAPSERLPHQVAVERLSLEGLRAEGATPIALGRFTLEGWRVGTPGSARLEALDLPLPGGGAVDRVQVARAALEGFDLAALLVAALQGEMPATPAAGAQAKRLEGLVLSRQGRVIGGVDRLVAENETRPDGAMRGRLTVHDASVEEVPELADIFAAVGLPRLSLELAIEGAWTPQGRRLAVQTFAFGVRELGALALGGVLDGIEMAAGTPDPANMRLVEGRLRYLDQSLYARVVESEARRERVPEARVRQLHAQILGGALTDAQADPALDVLREALLRFVRGEAREIEIALRPARPVTLEALQPAAAAGPAALVRLLGVSAVAR